MQQDNRTFQAKLHRLPSSVVRSASSHPLQIQEEKYITPAYVSSIPGEPKPSGLLTKRSLTSKI